MLVDWTSPCEKETTAGAVAAGAIRSSQRTNQRASLLVIHPPLAAHSRRWLPARPDVVPTPAPAGPAWRWQSPHCCSASAHRWVAPHYRGVLWRHQCRGNRGESSVSTPSWPILADTGSVAQATVRALVGSRSTTTHASPRPCWPKGERSIVYGGLNWALPQVMGRRLGRFDRGAH